MYEIEAKDELGKYYFMEVKTNDNQAFLPLDYIPGLKRILLKMVYEVEGKRISKLPETFYPSFSREQHVLEDHEEDELLKLNSDSITHSTTWWPAWTLTPTSHQQPCGRRRMSTLGWWTWSM